MSKGLIPELGGEEDRKEGQVKVKLKHTANEEGGIRFFTGVMLRVVGRIYIIHSMENSYVSDQTQLNQKPLSNLKTEKKLSITDTGLYFVDIPPHTMSRF